MKKFFYNIILISLLLFISLVAILSTFGVETNKFNNIISKKINNINDDINLEINTIKFKLDIKELSLFLETKNSIFKFSEISIPVKNIKVYVDFISLIQSKPKLSKINLTLDQIDQEKLKNISLFLKPSNLTSMINNKLKKIELNTELEIYLSQENLLNNYIARGSVSNLKIEILNDIFLENISFNFFADKDDILLKNISSSSESLKVLDSDLKINLSQGIALEANFKTLAKMIKGDKKLNKLTNQFTFLNDLTNLEANLLNNIKLTFDETFKVTNFYFQTNGDITAADFIFDKPIINDFFNKKINQLSLSNLKLNTKFKFDKSTTNISGQYSLNKKDPLSFELSHNTNNEKFNFIADFDYKEPFEFDLINYTKTSDSIAKISINLEREKDKIQLKNIEYKEGDNYFLAKDIKFQNGKLKDAKRISIITKKNGNKNNDFSVIFDEKIILKGHKFDASKLPKILSKNIKKDNFSYINKEIEIDFTNIIIPLSENLRNFKLLGKIEKGKFNKISSKGDFGKNNFLDLTMKKDQKSNKKYLEIYSDLAKPLLTEFNFFEGLIGGNLLYTSVFDENNSVSKLKIENFKVVNAPGMVKLLSLADLSGLADLAEGEGLSFDSLEISMEKNDNVLKLNEILALGPSLSVLMEGYQDSKITSLKGTLVPAKNLNKLLSKIPVLGEIIIPKEVGEGLFGISFKMKGAPGNIKTSINPIRTVTPRFIQKIIEKNKSSK